MQNLICMIWNKPTVKQAVVLFTIRDQCFCGAGVIWAKHPRLSVFILQLCWFCLFSVSYIIHIFDLFFKHTDDEKHLNIPRIRTAKHSHKIAQCVCVTQNPIVCGWCITNGAAYVNICLAEGVYSLSYLNKQIISGSAPLPSGTCFSFTEMTLSAGSEREGRVP